MGSGCTFSATTTWASRGRWASRWGTRRSWGRSSWPCSTGARRPTLPSRDDFVGWDEATREGLPLVVGNRRFLVLPWIGIPHLASRILGANLRRLSSDWQASYGHPLLLAETFVDLSRFKGTCYRAANWVCLGQTLGSTYTHRDGARPRGCPKAVYVYPLARDAQRRLCST